MKIPDLPVTNDPPLELHAPKPVFANSHSRSAFGFQGSTTDLDEDIIMTNDVAEANDAVDVNKMDEDIDIGDKTPDSIDEQSPDEDDRVALAFLKGEANLSQGSLIYKPYQEILTISRS